MFENNEEVISQMKLYYDNFKGTGSYHILFLLGILIIILFVDLNKKGKIKLFRRNLYQKENSENDIEESDINKKTFFTFGIFSILAIIMLCLPITFKVFTKLTRADEYHRLMWVLPINIVIALGITILISKTEPKFKKIIGIICAIIILFISGKNLYPFGNNASLLKIPDGAYEIIYTISKYDNDYKKIAGPEEIIIYTRQYDASISLSTGRSFQYESYFYMPLKKQEESKQAMWAYNYCISNDVNYLVIKNEDEKIINDLSNFDSKMGIELIYTGGCYRIFRINEALLKMNQ